MNHGFLTRAQVYFFDLDGCVYHGDQLSPGTVPLLRQLRRLGIDYAFLTNNSRLSAAEIGARLAAMGLEAAPECILPVTDIAGSFIRDKYGTVTVKTIGSESLERGISAAGHRIVSWDEGKADIVVVGRDTAFHYDKLQQISSDIGSGSRLVATNPDIYHPGAQGIKVPETGALLAAIEAMTGVAAECIGKPEPYMFQYGMKLYDASPENCVMVGDNPDTDILGSARAGLRSVWITNGASAEPPSRQREPGRVPPCPADIVLSNMAELCRLVGGSHGNRDIPARELEA
ncbi:HAD superfamily hydrolase (TIGR01450 family) [Paenibacillus forsythiae]|uniref:HAD superfamily hydrolase (TIGR01450 family) n=1 Tax=Paenibacillus forsythiae TaxID=365616 RepID=A0ABU3H8Z9_9BACL|nr:HAD-IIA family hydrolase [Paenibacillus forsythiae]MDT3427298.1 HAD superfamily hydrolase (TIGR01450 family) [Paenibacillus forsythiae]